MKPLFLITTGGSKMNQKWSYQSYPEIIGFHIPHLKSFLEQEHDLRIFQKNLLD